MALARLTQFTLLSIATAAAAEPQASIRMSVRSGKPLQQICLQLADKFHLRISYEEAPIRAKDVLIDQRTATGTVRKELQPMDLTITVPNSLSTADEVSTREAFEKIVQTCNSAKNSTLFKAIYLGGRVIQVVPTAARDDAGRFQPFEPLLDTRISLPRKSYVLGELVAAVLDQISQRRSVAIVMATVPTNLFAQVTITEEATEEPARDILNRVFEVINGPRLAMHVPYVALTWYLMYNLDQGHYFFNIHVLPTEAPEGHSMKL
jgi:hypothetical protein